MVTQTPLCLGSGPGCWRHPDPWRFRSFHLHQTNRANSPLSLSVCLCLSLSVCLSAILVCPSGDLASGLTQSTSVDLCLTSAESGEGLVEGSQTPNAFGCCIDVWLMSRGCLNPPLSSGWKTSSTVQQMCQTDSHKHYEFEKRVNIRCARMAHDALLSGEGACVL